MSHGQTWWERQEAERGNSDGDETKGSPVEEKKRNIKDVTKLHPVFREEF